MKSIKTGYFVDYVCPCGNEWQTVWSCACDDECSECGRDVEASDYTLDGTYSEAALDHYNLTGIMGDKTMRIFEVIAHGFDASSDLTDNRVLWVQAHRAELDQVRVEQFGARIGDDVTDMIGAGFDIDFVVPFESDLLQRKLREFQGVNHV